MNYKKTENMSNQNIYLLSLELIENFKDDNKTFPAKLNFYLQKNKETFIKLGESIEREKMRLIEKYGDYVENENIFKVQPEYIKDANNELNELLALEQEVTYYIVPLDWFDEIDLTQSQMKTLLFMISEENEND